MYLPKWMLFGDFWPWPWHLWLSLVFATKCRLRDCSPHQGHHYFPASSSWETWHFKTTVVGWRCLLFMKGKFFFPSWTCSGPWSFSTIALYIQSIYFCRCVLNAVYIFTWITFLNKTECRLQTCLSSVDIHHQKTEAKLLLEMTHPWHPFRKEVILKQDPMKKHKSQRLGGTTHIFFLQNYLGHAGPIASTGLVPLPTFAWFFVVHVGISYIIYIYIYLFIFMIYTSPMDHFSWWSSKSREPTKRFHVISGQIC